ncbi:4-hydroxyphenylpyruvate dioxygenase [Streptomyces sp. 5-10]|uniref:4-hydroxyphenylpyruvate dioxygenase n=1 Tax=Streptomyces sp. 5-10 TaxID=878925 RepID=UPI00168AFEF8|nr:4-hydroxyphenylpyruvate dioxygenase [Streptomyces sp. 5-10]MBD3009009.1 4-hydroxyphenylpyruvate dioxygenase [Streptomyces sp. 5-10]
MSAFEELGVDYVGFAVGDLDQASAWWADRYGMSVYARSPDGRHEGRVRTAAMAKGDIRLVLVEAGSADHPAAAYTERHGDGVCDIALSTPDAAAAFEEAVRRGARPVERLRQRDGVVTASIAGFGDVTHTFVQRLSSADAHALPGLTPRTGPPPGHGAADSTGLKSVDHFAVCVEAGQLTPTVAYYETVLDFRTVFSERILVGRQAMDSIAVQSRSGTVTLTILEPDLTKEPGQVDRFIKDHGGAGVQHIAFTTDDITREVSALGARGVEFLTTPGTYYEQLRERLRLRRYTADRLRELNVLVDEDQDGQLLQIFTRSVHPRSTLFFEIIERAGARTFGSGNIKALYAAVEAERPHAAADGTSREASL